MHTAICDVVRVINPIALCLEIIIIIRKCLLEKYFIPTFLLMVYDCDFFYFLVHETEYGVDFSYYMFFLMKGEQCFYLPCYTEAAQMVFWLFVSAS
jgi:hypothetical protein